MNAPRLLAAATVLCAAASAEVEEVVIEETRPVLDGREWGEAGSYELLVGRARFAWDPANESNEAVVDLDLAPVGEDGKVRAEADLVVLRPTRPVEDGVTLIEVSNRGGMATLAYLNRAAYSTDPREERHFGDGFLMRRGVTVVWVGWQADVPTGARLRLHAPAVEGDVEGLVRCDWTVDEDRERLELGHRSHLPYAVSDPDAAGDEHVLTWRPGREAERVVVPRADWRFVEPYTATSGGLPTEGERRTRYRAVAVEGGFRAGRIYELVYRARDPLVIGLGLAVIRDTASYARHVDDSVCGNARTVALGISQTGRFLRTYLYQGFHTDEEGRPALDGVLAHTAGAGRGSFNHRFAQPSRDAHRYSAFFYPTDVYPFSGRAQRDPLTGRREGLLDRVSARGHAPKVFYTNTGYEYWGRAAALLHVSLGGAADVEPLENERLYHLASAQHYVLSRRGLSAEAGGAVFRGNPLDFHVAVRALFSALLDWVVDGREPPPSRYPRIDTGELVALEDYAFPRVPGLAPPRVAHCAYRVDYGPRWSAGIVDHAPPVLGEPFPVLVPDVDELGNERGGVATLETLVPLATYTPWHVRRGLAGGNGELSDFVGSFAPLARTAEERAPEDARPSVAELYADRASYLERAREAADRLVAERFLLEEDRARALERAAARWDEVTGD